MNKRTIVGVLAVFMFLLIGIQTVSAKPSAKDALKVGDQQFETWKILSKNGTTSNSEKQFDLVIMIYEGIIKDYPKSKEAEEAKKRLADPLILAEQKKRNETKLAEENQKRQQEEAKTAEAAQALRGYVRLYSVFNGTVLLNGEATQFTAKAGEEISVTVENAKDKEYTVAVRDSNSKVYETKDKVIFSSTGNSDNPYRVIILDPNPAPNSGNDFDIKQNAQGGITITRYRGTRKQVIIPERIEGVKVTEIAPEAFLGSEPVLENPFGYRWKPKGTQIISVVIPNTVTTIGSKAFYAQTSLVTVTLSNSITIIQDRVFYECASLSSITIPNSVQTIGEYAFFNCKSLGTVTIPNSVTTIGIAAFVGCNLQSVNLGRGITRIGAFAFAFNQIKELTLPSSLQAILSWAFYCNMISSITIPNGVTYLSGYCFGGNPITTVVIPPSLATMTTKNTYMQELWFTPTGSTPTSGFGAAFSNDPPATDEIGNPSNSYIFLTGASGGDRSYDSDSRIFYHDMTLGCNRLYGKNGSKDNIKTYVDRIPSSNISNITLPANVDERNLSSNFDSNLVDFWKSQNKKAGTYINTGRIWTVR